MAEVRFARLAVHRMTREPLALLVETEGDRVRARAAVDHLGLRPAHRVATATDGRPALSR